jgi:Predicted membrane protein
MNTYNIVRGLHILAVIAWMAGLLFLPRLFAYDAEMASRPEPVRDDMRALLRVWQRRLLRIILNPAMTLAWIFGAWLFWLRSDNGSDWSFAHQPWMITKLTGVVLLTIWHHYLAIERKRIDQNRSVRSARFWRMTNEIPFLLAIIMVLSVTTEWVLP